MSELDVLLVEDDEAIAGLIERALMVEGYRVACETTLAGAWMALGRQSPGLVLLDLNLPDGDGIEWLSRFRVAHSAPVIVLSARSQEHDKVNALNNGADDYLCKPFGLPELLARLRATLRRYQPHASAGGKLFCDSVVIDLQQGLITRDGQKVHLTAKEFQVLYVLASSPGKLVRQRELLQSVWGPEYVNDTHYLRILMSKLRVKLERNPSEPVMLLTEPGVGYRLNASF